MNSVKMLSYILPGHELLNKFWWKICESNLKLRFLWIFWWKWDCFKYLGTLFACKEWNYELWKVVLSTHHELPKYVEIDEFFEIVELQSSQAWAFKLSFWWKICESNLKLHFLWIFWWKLDFFKYLGTLLHV